MCMVGYLASWMKFKMLKWLLGCGSKSWEPILLKCDVYNMYLYVIGLYTHIYCNMTVTCMLGTCNMSV